MQKKKRHKGLQIGFAVLMFILTVAFIAPALYRTSPYEQDLNNSFSAPSSLHPMGTDMYGRDLMARLMKGTSNTIKVSVLATAIAVFTGMVVGILSGLFGGIVDELTMRAADVLLGFPKLIVVLLVSGVITDNIFFTFFLVGCLSWMETARVIRGEVKIIKESLLYKSLLAAGLSFPKIFFGYIFPLLRGKVLVSFTLNFASFILVEVSLSFIGLGYTSPEPSLGTLLKQARYDPVSSCWLIIFTGIIITILVASINLIGDGIKEVLENNAPR